MNEVQLKRVMIVIIILAVITAILSYMIGYAVGVQTSIKWGVEVAKHFVNISVDESQLSHAIYQYQNQIGQCWGNNLTI